VTVIDKPAMPDKPSRFHDRGTDLDGAAVLITGGSGSFGRRLAHELLTRYRLRRLAIYSRDEAKQVDMAQEFQAHDNFNALRFFIGDVRDQARLKMAMREVDYVIHAAALKHVPVAEYNPMECIHTNVLGAENVVYAALENRVKRVIALSTDKAVNPINLYGASKLASDKIFVAANNLSGSVGTKFSVVRYGNVVGSRGSVVPLFQKLVREGARHLPITDERMTRFWITLLEGVDFVLSNLRLMQGGEIFVPKIPSMKMVDLAKCMAPDLPIKVIGIRPGEKLHEALISIEQAPYTRALPDRYIIQPELAFWERKEIEQWTRAVPETFSYTSDNNDEWLSADELRQMVAETSSGPVHA
jgi:UDP-N-acetylglucosamine 4,6-dehydratase